MTKKITVAGLGCGERVWIYMRLIAEQADKFEIVAAADPVKEYRERLRAISASDEFQEFADGDSLLQAGKIADVLIIGTQDRYHYEPCMKALELGYDVVLEKPISPFRHEVLEIEAKAKALGRRMLVCHVYRYTPLFIKAKALLDQGAIGEVISMNATEGVEPWHFAHSFVRGHWSVEARSNPIILAKTCHDLDLLSWMIGAKFSSVSSFGGIQHFRKENAPPNQQGELCQSLVSGEITTPFCALRYLQDKKDPWLAQIFPRTEVASDEEILAWLRESPWGRSVYHCDNDVCDHQIMGVEFENGVTVNFTMTAFETGRYWEIHGTKGVMRIPFVHDDNHDLKIIIDEHHGGDTREIPVKEPEGGYRFHHEGGDVGMVEALYSELTGPADAIKASASNSLESHMMAFAAEISRKEKRVVTRAEMLKPN
ncbi:MAG: Gfo/Idh/MocA family oxidoreductase [Porticoccaceae bacterium]|nr:Gfo/Idh/MocA family oxidoreductase [Porticoccaceae bacterium]